MTGVLERNKQTTTNAMKSICVNQGKLEDKAIRILAPNK